jgi:hypothetical protein
VGLAEDALAAAAGLGAAFLGLAVFLVAVTFGCSGASVTCNRSVANKVRLQKQ